MQSQPSTYSSSQTAFLDALLLSEPNDTLLHQQLSAILLQHAQQHLSAAAFCKVAEVLESHGRLEDAITGYIIATELDPDNAAVFKSLGSALKHHGRLKSAVMAYRTAVELDPHYTVAFNDLTSTLEKGQDTKVILTDQTRIDLQLRRMTEELMLLKSDIALLYSELEDLESDIYSTDSQKPGITRVELDNLERRLKEHQKQASNKPGTTRAKLFSLENRLKEHEEQATDKPGTTRAELNNLENRLKKREEQAADKPGTTRAELKDIESRSQEREEQAVDKPGTTRAELNKLESRPKEHERQAVDKPGTTRAELNSLDSKLKECEEQAMDKPGITRARLDGLESRLREPEEQAVDKPGTTRAELYNPGNKPKEHQKQAAFKPGTARANLNSLEIRWSEYKHQVADARTKLNNLWKGLERFDTSTLQLEEIRTGLKAKTEKNNQTVKPSVNEPLDDFNLKATHYDNQGGPLYDLDEKGRIQNEHSDDLTKLKKFYNVIIHNIFEQRLANQAANNERYKKMIAEHTQIIEDERQIRDEAISRVVDLEHAKHKVKNKYENMLAEVQQRTTIEQQSRDETAERIRKLENKFAEYINREKLYKEANSDQELIVNSEKKEDLEHKLSQAGEKFELLQGDTKIDKLEIQIAQLSQLCVELNRKSVKETKEKALLALTVSELDLRISKLEVNSADEKEEDLEMNINEGNPPKLLITVPEQVPDKSYDAKNIFDAGKARDIHLRKNLDSKEVVTQRRPAQRATKSSIRRHNLSIERESDSGVTEQGYIFAREAKDKAINARGNTPGLEARFIISKEGMRINTDTYNPDDLNAQNSVIQEVKVIKEIEELRKQNWQLFKMFNDIRWNQVSENKLTVYDQKKDVDNKYCYDRKGYDKEGYDYEGYNKEGYDKESYDKEGYNNEGYNKKGYNKKGYDKEGYNKEGYNKEERTKEGYDREGYNRRGYDKEGYDKEGYDKEGYKIENYGNYRRSENQNRVIKK